jgi:ABC-type glycerol-3-phosphate transport system substrate-binding protein
MKNLRAFLLVVSLISVLSLLAACGGPAPTPTAVPVVPTKAPAAPTAAPAAPTAAPAAPTKPAVALKGELNLLCTPQEIWCQGMKKEFEAIYPGVTVNYIRLSAGEALTRLRNEKANPQFDIWWGGPIDSQIAAKKDGLLDPYKTAGQANILDPKLMLDSDAVPSWSESTLAPSDLRRTASKPP